MTRRFTIITDPDGQFMCGRRFELDVVVHANVRAMRKAAHRHDPDMVGDLAGAAACFQIARYPHPRGYSYLGVARFAVEHVNALVVLHEAVHAGVALALKLANYDNAAGHPQRLVLAPHSDGLVASINEERIAYASSELALALLVALGLGDGPIEELEPT